MTLLMALSAMTSITFLTIIAADDITKHRNRPADAVSVATLMQDGREA